MPIQDFMYHIHTYRCNHAIGDDEQYVLQAIKGGYKTIGFSDHSPLPGRPVTRWRMSYDQFDEYIASITSLKEKYKDQIDIKIGIEAEPFDGCDELIDSFFQKLDYVIVSQHGTDSEHQFLFAHYNTDEEILNYGKLVEQNLSKKPWLYLAHPDYFLRDQNDFNQACIETTHRICQAAVKNNTIFEVNTSGLYSKKVHYKQGDFFFYPNPLFWQIVAQYPIKCVYGLDAHTPEVLSKPEYLEIAQKELAGLDLQFINEPLVK